MKSLFFIFKAILLGLGLIAGTCIFSMEWPDKLPSTEQAINGITSKSIYVKILEFLQNSESYRLKEIVHFQKMKDGSIKFRIPTNITEINNTAIQGIAYEIQEWYKLNKSNEKMTIREVNTIYPELHGVISYEPQEVILSFNSPGSQRRRAHTLKGTSLIKQNDSTSPTQERSTLKRLTATLSSLNIRAKFAEYLPKVTVASEFHTVSNPELFGGTRSVTVVDRVQTQAVAPAKQTNTPARNPLLEQLNEEMKQILQQREEQKKK